MTCVIKSKIPVADLVPSLADIAVYQGSAEAFEVLLLDRNVTVNIALDSVIFTVRDRIGGDIMLQKTNGPGEHFDAANGKTVFYIDEADLISTDVSREWVFEVRRRLPTGVEHVHIFGRFLVVPAVGD